MEKDFRLVSTPIMAIAGRQDKGNPRTALEAWRQWTSGAFEVKVVEGGHMDCINAHLHVIADMERLTSGAARRVDWSGVAMTWRSGTPNAWENSDSGTTNF